MSSACILVRLSAELAEQFPPERGERAGEGPPHVTVAYVPDPADAMMGDISAALRTAALVGGPFSLALTGGLHLFPPTAEGETPVCIAVQSEGLLGFRRRFLADLGATQPAAADAADNAHGGYVPHATVRYAAPGEPTEVEPRPRGGMIVESVELWVGDELQEVVRLAPAAPKPIALRARSRQRERLVLDARPLPSDVTVLNRGGYHIGQPFRMCTVGSSVYCITTGERRVTITAEDMAEVCKVYETRRARGEGLPRINFGHQPSDPDAPQPRFFGEIAAMYLADDGERGPGLYAVPAWTNSGRDYAAEHMSPDKTTSLLANSPEFAFGDRFARAQGDGETGELIGRAEVVGVALTEFPAQSEGQIDAVLLDAHRPTDSGRGAAGGESMDGMTEGAGAQVPETQAPPVADAGGDTGVTRAEYEDLNGRVGRMSSVLDQIAAKVLAPDAAEATVEAEATPAEEDPKPVEMEAAAEDEEIAAELTAAEESKDPAAQALAAKLRARLKGQVSLSAKRQATESATRLKAVEVALAAERAERFKERCASTIETYIAQGLFTPAERKSALLQLTAATRTVSTPEGREMQAVVKAAWDDLVAKRHKSPAVNMSARGVPGDQKPAEGAGLVERLESFAKAQGLDFDKDAKGVRLAFRAKHPDEYQQLTARRR